MNLYCGWDWGTTQHGVCVIDDAGAVVRTWLIGHDQLAVNSLFDELARLADPGQVTVAIERREGLVVGLIADAGHPVAVVDPAGFKAARPRWGAAGAKSDVGDAFMLADYLRTDGHRLHRAQSYDQATADLTALVRARRAAVDARTAASNGLWAFLGENWPGAREVFASLTSKIALAFLCDYPTPSSAARLGPARMAGFCHRHGYNGQRSAAELVARLRSAPAPANTLGDAALRTIVAASVAQIRALNQQVCALDDQIAVAVQRHPMTPLLARLPRAGTVSLALLLAEVGPILARCSTAEQAAAMCGAVPVTRASGKTHTVGFRYAAHKPARVAITGFADNSRHASQWAHQRYRQARARGARHPHAVRILARGWIRVLWTCWHTGIPYDPARHRGEQHARSIAMAADLT